MQTLLEHGLDEAPLYIRWNPDGGPPVAVELRLDLISRLRAELDAAEKLGIEVGGLLMGTPANALTPSIRADDYLMIARGPEDGPVFMLDPREYDRFLTTRWDAKTRDRRVVGFFRTHIRPGPLRPSLADRTLLAAQFTHETYIVLLIEGREPRRTALLVGTGAKLPDEASVPEFNWNEAEFSTLPERELTAGRFKKPKSGRTSLMAAVFVCVLFTAALVLFWARQGASLPFRASHDIQLSAAGNRILTVTWNHSAPDVAKARSGKLIVDDGPSSREIAIGQDELRLGTIEYERATDQVKLTLVLEMPSAATSVIQSFTWHA